MVIEWPEGLQTRNLALFKVQKKRQIRCFSGERPWLLGREYSSVCLCFAGVLTVWNKQITPCLLNNAFLNSETVT